MTQEALKLALTALEINLTLLKKITPYKGQEDFLSDSIAITQDTTTAIKEALAQPEPCDMGDICIGCSPRNADGSCPSSQPEQEPVAWTLLLTGEHNGLIGKAGEKFIGAPDYYQRVNVYTALPQRTWVGLTDDEMEATFIKCGGKWNGDFWKIEDADFHPFLRTIEAKLKELNT